MSENSHFVIEKLREIYESILYSSIGESAGRAVLLLLRRNLKRDPFIVLWEDPIAFHKALEKVLGVGARVLVRLLVNVLTESGLTINSDYFLELINRGAVEEIRSYLMKIADSHGKK
ncbi:MAG: hypothetical protein QXY75_07325 [Candidatus Bathyarchaeia archaeon]